MPTSAERRALMFLAAVALVGGGVRLVGVQQFEHDVTTATRRVDHVASPTVGGEELRAQIAAVDSARENNSSRGRRKRTTTSANGPSPRTARSKRSSSSTASLPTLPSGPTPPTPSNPLDVNDASAEDLERLPRVGPALAQRILARRDSLGPYGSIDDLRHVRGIGVRTTALLAPLVTFGGGHRPLQSEIRSSRRYLVSPYSERH